MTTPIELDANQVPAHLRGDYMGRKFRAVIGDTVMIPIDAGLWDGGSRDLFRAVRLSDGAGMEMPGQRLFHEGRRAYTVEIPPGAAIVRDSTFQGKRTGLTFYVRASDVAPLLPAPVDVDLSREAQFVLAAAVGLVASYRREACERQGVNRNAYDRIREALASQGLLTASGAITVKGRNVVAALPSSIVNSL
jgi:hypothetical protein